ncbi:MAG: hypothetical protein ABJI23_13485 [Marinobacter sp.]|uniref:hypothetical protein n=1 Tax=Marinobacter sp. TaxID=50741 RepID=UPI003299CA3D
MDCCENDSLWKLSVGRLIRHCDPITCNEEFPVDVWDTGLSVEMIYHCLQNEELMIPDHVGAAPRDPMVHAGRIAWLVENGWHDAIEIDVGVPGAPGQRDHWPVTDGNHRLAAAIIRGDDAIEASISGSIDHAHRLFMDICHLDKPPCYESGP